MHTLAGKNILLGISGGIAAYKAAEWIRRLREESVRVEVVMTEAAQRFVTPLTLAALAGNKVHTGIFDPKGAHEIPHISLAKECDLILVAPATATTIARLAHGLGDDLLSCIVLAARKPVLVCPAMNSAMYEHPATQANLKRLHALGYRVVEPACGPMACGDTGPGRLVTWETIRHQILSALLPQDLDEMAVLVTAGPTHEHLDPVRFLTNRSSGKMGYALAATAAQRGARVLLVSGPTELPCPDGVERIMVTSALEMHQAVMERAESMSVVVMAAAVSDFRPVQASSRKIKKKTAPPSIELAENPDILYELGMKKKQSRCFPLLVGFAAESEEIVANAGRKLAEKNLDLIVANDITSEDAGFGVDTNRVVLIDTNDTAEELPLLTKEQVAHRIWDCVLRLKEV